MACHKHTHTNKAHAHTLKRTKHTHIQLTQTLNTLSEPDKHLHTHSCYSPEAAGTARDRRPPLVLLFVGRTRRQKLLELPAIETATVLLLLCRARRWKRLELLAIEDFIFYCIRLVT